MAGQKHFTGYRKSDVWDALGLIGDTLQFTDDEVTTKVGIGYTRTQVNLRTAMEAALQFTYSVRGRVLNSHGKTCSTTTRDWPITSKKVLSSQGGTRMKKVQTWLIGFIAQT